MDELTGIPEDQIRKIQSARQRVIESIGQNMDIYGVNLSIAYLYGHMFFRNHPVTLDDMGQTMGMSKTSISTGMRTLIDLKMVNKVWEKGARKDLYEVEGDWYRTLSDFFSIKWKKAAELNSAALKRSLTEMRKLLEQQKEQPEAEGSAELCQLLENDIAKMEEALGYYNWFHRLVEAFESGEIFKLVPKDKPEA
ncbi:GbsR/MarR family transcriptional regulator [Paenibacillus turpanensis]|uniref:GbsR/MarR family transcriptional regulator n=1 Tax=Paenibacillus turpanensis TaxID=2689078 RepID=UPI0014094BF5|nr:GbsR/MarR family transcriptional regulator [Paenibacillus turpanensis]